MNQSDKKPNGKPKEPPVPEFRAKAAKGIKGPIFSETNGHRKMGCTLVIVCYCIKESLDQFTYSKK